MAGRVSSEPGALRAERTAEESARLRPLVELLKSRLNVTPLPESQVIRVSFDHTDPELAAAIVNQAAKIFIDRSFERKTSRFAGASDWLDRSTRELKSKVAQAEHSLRWRSMAAQSALARSPSSLCEKASSTSGQPAAAGAVVPGSRTGLSASRRAARALCRRLLTASTLKPVARRPRQR